MEKLVVTILSTTDVYNENTGFASPRYLVSIEGKSPRIDGWVLAARIENNDLIGTVVRVVPGPHADCDYSSYRTHDFSCDHCNTKRRRNDVFVLVDCAGNRKVVGRNCLADFLRTGDAGSFAEWAEWCDTLGSLDESSCSDLAYDDGFGSGDGRPVVALGRYLTVTAMITRRMGWMSRTAARKCEGAVSTADNVNYFLYGRGSGHERWVRENELSLGNNDADVAGRAIEWAKALTSEKIGQSEYLHTIHRIATVGVMGAGLDGFAASIIRAYEKDCEWAAEREENDKRPERDWIGIVGERLRDLPVRVLRVNYCDTPYGVSTLVVMEMDLPGNYVAPLVWFASGEKDYDEGADYVMTATVKGHDDCDKYGKQTKVNRAKLVKRETVTN